MAVIQESEPTLSESTLLSGATFRSAHVENAVSESVCLHLNAGSARESEGQHGALHFFEHLPPASFRTISSNSEDILTFANNRSWRLHIHINKYCLTVGFTATALDSDEILHVLGSIIGNSKSNFREVFPVEKGRILEEIQQTSVKSHAVFADVVNGYLAQGTGFAHPTAGTAAEVSGYTFEEIYQLGQQYIRPENMTLAVSGGSALISQARDYFDSHKILADENHFETLAPYKVVADWERIPKVVTHSSPLFPGIELAAFVPVTYSLDPRTEIIRSIVVSELSNRLSGQLSHRLGLTYSAYAFEWQFPGTSAIGMGCSVEPKNFDQALLHFNKEIDHFSASLTQEVIDNYCMKELSSAYQGTWYQNYQGLLEAINNFPEKPYVSPSERLKIMQEVSLEEVKKFAETFIRSDSGRLFLFGSDEALRSIAKSISAIK